MTLDPIVILAARRTPMGAFQGALAAVPAPELGAAALRAAIADTGLPPGDIDEVLMGCVLSAGIGQAPARQAALAAGIPIGTPAATINKMCGSGMYALMLGADRIRAGAVGVVAAGGLESMSNAPYLVPKARAGLRLGHQQLVDHLFKDGIESPWDRRLMGSFADTTAERYGYPRAAQDAYAAQSLSRAQAAQASGGFEGELIAVQVTQRRATSTVAIDEIPGTLDAAKIPGLKPAFSPQGTVTAASSSGIADGAAALVIARASWAAARGITPLAVIRDYVEFAREPEWFTLAPVGAIRRLLERLRWQSADVDLYEINEAFAVVAMAAIRELGLDPALVNVHGGACALGHPIGASGARIIVTLVHAMRARGARRGIASLCIGGGEATAIALELP
jgi:acetyl-CoA C-acetyltransferase